MRRVVVTGLGAITPVGKDINDFWDSLTAGRHGIAPITRFDTADFKATLAAEVKDFSPADYYTDKSEMRRTDLFAQYAMGAAVQAMTDSGIEGKIAPERLGVYVGSGIGGITTFVNETLKLQERGPSRVSPFFIPMMISNMAAGTIAIRFAAKGPTLPVVTACATSSNTVGEAFRAIAYGYADAILAGGSEATICPLAVAGFTNSMALCESSDPDRASIPFDAQRSGFVMGEGAGMLVLEEYEHAAARDAKIYAEVVGYGNTCDAYHITAPHPEAEGAARAFALAVEQAGISSADKVYQRTWHQHADERQGRNARRQKGARRRGIPRADQLHEIDDRPYARRGRCGRSHRLGTCAAHRRPAADGRLSRRRPRMRSRLYSQPGAEIGG